MPRSYKDFKENVVSFMVSRLSSADTRVLDLGAGDGTFGSLIRSRFPNTDAVEIWAPYVERFALREKYRKVFVMRADELPREEVSDSAIVIGDMLEHLSVGESRRLIRNLIDFGARLIVIVVPWLYEQGPEHPSVISYGNPYEVHQQPDLTHELFLERYPQLTPLIWNERCGVYFWEARDG